MAEANSWSAGLIEKTRAYLREIDDWALFTDELHLKNADRRFATIGMSEVGKGIMELTDRKTGEKYSYASIDEVIADGWVVD